MLDERILLCYDRSRNKENGLLAGGVQALCDRAFLYSK